MLAALSGLLPGVLAKVLPIGKLIGIGLAGVAVLAAGFYVWSLRAEVSDLQEQASLLEARAALLRENYTKALGAVAANEAAYDAERAAHKRTAAALDAASRRAVSHARRATALEEAARHAPPEDDGPVAPVLRAVLDGMRRHPDAGPASGPGGGDRGAHGTADGAEPPAGVPTAP